MVGEPVEAVGDPVPFVGESVELVGEFVPFVGEPIVPVGDPVTVEEGAGVYGGPPAQFMFGSASLSFTASKRGVEKSSIKSPVSSQIRKPFKLLLMTYSVFSQIERSSS